jgi:hypothetical protein
VNEYHLCFYRLFQHWRLFQFAMATPPEHAIISRVVQIETISTSIPQRAAMPKLGSVGTSSVPSIIMVVDGSDDGEPVAVEAPEISLSFSPPPPIMNGTYLPPPPLDEGSKPEEIEVSQVRG